MTDSTKQSYTNSYKIKCSNCESNFISLLTTWKANDDTHQCENCGHRWNDNLPRPVTETTCPCPNCLRCCCNWVKGLDEDECVNFDEFGRCECGREVH